MPNIAIASSPLALPPALLEEITPRAGTSATLRLANIIRIGEHAETYRLDIDTERWPAMLMPCLIGDKEETTLWRIR